MRIRLCGVRGSTPATGPEFVRYGGSTACVALTLDSEDRPSLLLDAGTGIRKVSALLDGEGYSGAILLSHLHWDHLQGLPFFAGGDQATSAVEVFVPAPDDGPDALDLLAGVMAPPYFPITPDELRGNWTFSPIHPGTFSVGGFAVEAAEIPHKGGRTLGFRISDGRTTVAYLPDHCPSLLGPGPDGLGPYHDAALALCADADVVIHDAQILREEQSTRGFLGHAAAEYAVGLGHAASARSVVLFHHDPERTDAELDAIGRRFAGDPAVLVAVEGTVLTC